MPMYDYKCNECSHLWEENLTMSNRDLPCSNPCPNCGKTDCVVKHVGGFPTLATDSTLTADKKTGGRWSEIMERVKNSVPKSYHDNLNHNISGRRWKG